MDATAAAIVSDGKKRVGLLGTRATMEYGFFQKHFQTRGIETLVPDKEYRHKLDRIIWEELSHGIITPEARAAAQGMLTNLTYEGAEAIILGCTELSMLIKPKDSPQPLYDTTRIHAEAILQFALNDSQGDRSNTE
jgi:aspartate racemase